MINFDRKPDPKTENEKVFDELQKKYEKKFGKSYVFHVGTCNTWEETLADISKRIMNNDPQPEPEYEPGVDY